jgi:aspartyl-tRNA(Asn)/glutamyl-tRNA(Gln) amidotransferase subunit A
MVTNMKPLLTLAQELGSGTTTAAALAEDAIARAADPAGEGRRVYLKRDDAAARAAASAADRLRVARLTPSPLAGIPFSIKDLFDVAGEVTTAASHALADAKPALADAPAIARLRRAGAVAIGRTNMTEFAYSGLGLNAHFDTPRNPWDRATGRIPGGSSSGAAVSITDGMAAFAIGTDTGGSVRIPAALCGITGFKPTARRVPTAGAFPLSSSLDSVGPLAPTVACCALVDAVMRGVEPTVPQPLPLTGLRFGVPQSYVLDGLDKDVSAAFSAALGKLSRAGARIVDVKFDSLTRIPQLSPHGGVLAAEAYAVHRKLLESKGDLYDARVRTRILRGANLSAADYVDLVAARHAMIAEADAVTAPFDAMLLPTVAIVAPPIAALDADEKLYGDTNLLVLRNTTVGNYLDRCALSVPCHASGSAPVGLMVMGETMGDDRLLAVGLAVEAVLRLPASS